jgi:hypothetical protein
VAIEAESEDAIRLLVAAVVLHGLIGRSSGLSDEQYAQSAMAKADALINEAERTKRASR